MGEGPSVELAPGQHIAACDLKPADLWLTLIQLQHQCSPSSGDLGQRGLGKYTEGR